MLAEDVGAAVFKEVEDVFESFWAAVVGVGDEFVVVFGAEFAEHADFVVIFLARIEGSDDGEVIFVHDEDEIIGIEVSGVDFAGAMLEVDAAVGGGGAHALVG